MRKGLTPEIWLKMTKHYSKQRIITDRNRDKYGRDSKFVGVYFYKPKRSGHASLDRPWYVVLHDRTRANGSVNLHLGTYRTENEAGRAVLAYRKEHPLLSHEQRSLRQATRFMKGMVISGYRWVRPSCRRKDGSTTAWQAFISYHKNWTHFGTFHSLIAAAIASDMGVCSLYGSEIIDKCNFLPDGHRNPASMTCADRVLWIKGEYVEPILSLSSEERAELVALLIKKNVPVPAYLKPKS